MLSYFILFILYHIPRRILGLTEDMISNFTTSKFLYLCYCVYVSRQKQNNFIRPSCKKYHQKVIVNVYGNEGAGLTDRLNGMVATHIYCSDKNYIHKISHKVPFDLGRYFQPNSYDWRIEEKELENRENSLTLVLHSLRNKDVMHYVLNLYVQLHGLRRLFLTSCECVDQNVYSTNFHQLFKPSDYLLQLYKNALPWRIQQAYISISFRFCNLLGDSNERFLQPLEISQQKLLISLCLNQVDTLLKEKVPIIITSDSPKFLKTLSSKTNVFCITLPLLDRGITTQNHIGFSSTIDSSESDKIFLDFMSISSAQTAYQVKIGPMYKSRFPEYAAIVGNVHYKLIEFPLL